MIQQINHSINLLHTLNIWDYNGNMIIIKKLFGEIQNQGEYLGCENKLGQIG